MILQSFTIDHINYALRSSWHLGYWHFKVLIWILHYNMKSSHHIASSNLCICVLITFISLQNRQICVQYRHEFFCSFRIEHHLFGLELNSRLKIRRKFVSMTDDISPMWVLNSIIRLVSWNTSKVELMTEVLIIANQTSCTGNYKEIIYTFLIMYIHL